MSAKRFLPAMIVLALAGAAQGQDLQGTPAEESGRALFDEKCAMCHREANMVTGMGTFLIAKRDQTNSPMLENRDILTPDYIEAAIRNGIGNMPRISRGEVSDAQLAAISDYLVAAAAEEDSE